MQIEISNHFCRLSDDSTQRDIETYKQVRKNLCVKAPGADYIQAHKDYKYSKGKRGWDGLVSALHAEGVFPTGLLPEVVSILKNSNEQVSFVDKRIAPIVNINSTSINLRDYQQETIKKSLTNKFENLWWPRGVLELATGAGKTEVAIAIYQMVTIPTLFIVHRKTLGWQTVERFKQHTGKDVGFFLDAKKELNPSGVTVATIQSIASSIHKKDVQNLLSSTQQVFFDEAHQIAAKISGGNQFVKLSELLPNAYFRWGLTATPFHKDKYSNHLLAGATGNVLYSKKSKKLIEEGYLSPAKIFVQNVKAVYKCPKKWPDCYDIGIVLNKERTDLSVKWMENVPKPCFVLATQVSHAKILTNAAKIKKIKTEMLSGADSTKRRQEVLDNLSSGQTDVLVCTTIFDEGIDFPALKSIIMCGGGKSVIKVMQRLGRGLRKHESKKGLIVVDFYDESSATLKRHSKARIEVYKEEGFKVIGP